MPNPAIKIISNFPNDVTPVIKKYQDIKPFSIQFKKDFENHSDFAKHMKTHMMKILF